MTLMERRRGMMGMNASGNVWEKFISFMKNELTSIPALDGVTEVGTGMFQSCYRLTSFDFSNIVSIGEKAFYGANLDGVVVLPQKIQTLGNTAFRGNPFTKIVFKGGVTRFDTSVFEGCRNLEVIDATITFQNISIRATSFYNTQSLSTLILRQNLIPLDGAFPSSCKLATEGNVYVPSSLVESYKTTGDWQTYADRILPIEGSIYETQYADGSII